MGRRSSIMPSKQKTLQQLEAELLRTREALGQCQELFRATFEKAAVGMAHLATDGRFLRVNQRLADTLGYSREELVQKNLRQIIHPDDLAASLERFRQLVAGVIPTYTEEKRYFRKDGSVIWASFTVSVARKPTGEPDFVVAVQEDIGGRKRLEEEREHLLEQVHEANCRLVTGGISRRELADEAQKRTAELRAVIESIADGVIIYDRDGHVLHMNSAAQRSLAVSEEEFRSRSYEQWIKMLRLETIEGRPLAVEETPSWRALRAETVRGFVMVVHALDGRRLWASVSAAPICTPEGALLGAVTTFTDITELHRLQEQREDLVRSVSHDLRSPLTAVQGQAQLLLMLLERSNQDGNLRRSATAIFTNARRMNIMIQDLVDSVRAELQQLKLHRTGLHLSTFLRDYLQRMEGVLDTNRIRVGVPEELPAVWADADRLERVLTNLLSNGLKYSEAEVRVTAARLDGHVRVSVSDQGIGISREDLPRIFDRFYRARGARKAEGLGLGLYISRMLVEAMGGQIWAESQVGKGSTFYFTLPLAEAGAEG